MIYLTKERALFANDGRYIKHIECPLATKLARAMSKAEPEREFHCSECSSKVKNLHFLTDDQAIDAVLEDAEICFFATKEANNVVHLTFPIDEKWQGENEYRVGLKGGLSNDWPTVRTARGIGEMNFAIRNGFIVIPRKVGESAGTKESVALCQDSISGLFSYRNDSRWGWPNEEVTGYSADEVLIDNLEPNRPPADQNASRSTTRRIFDFFSYSKDEPVPPVAGYVIPKDLKPGSKVFLEDVIEHLVQSYPQERAESLPSWWGTWTGNEIVLARFEQDLIFG